MTTRLVRQTTALTFAGCIAAVAAAGPAAASVTDENLHATDQSPITAACTYSADVHWNRTTSHLSGTVTVTNYNWFEGCFKKLVVTLVDDRGTKAGDADIRIPTTCGTKDWNCAPAVNHPINQTVDVNYYAKPHIDHMNAVVLDRVR